MAGVPRERRKRARDSAGDAPRKRARGSAEEAPRKRRAAEDRSLVVYNDAPDSAAGDTQLIMCGGALSAQMEHMNVGGVLTTGVWTTTEPPKGTLQLDTHIPNRRNSQAHRASYVRVGPPSKEYTKKQQAALRREWNSMLDRSRRFVANQGVHFAMIAVPRGVPDTEKPLIFHNGDASQLFGLAQQCVEWNMAPPEMQAQWAHAHATNPRVPAPPGPCSISNIHHRDNSRGPGYMTRDKIGPYPQRKARQRATDLDRVASVANPVGSFKQGDVLSGKSMLIFSPEQAANPCLPLGADPLYQYLYEGPRPGHFLDYPS